MNNDHDDIVEKTMIRYLAGESTYEEQKEVSEQLAQNPQYARRFESLKRIFEESQKLYSNQKPASSINLDSEWDRFVKRIDKPSEIIVPLNPRTLSSNWFRFAASFLLLAASAWAINFFVLSKGDMEFQTAENTLVVALPDGSTVTLNHHSFLSYTKAFGNENRTVKLKGEGFFDVAHDTKKPFVIHVDEAQVEVVGTSFSIQGYETQKELEVIVQTGVVRMSLPALNLKIQLTVGQKGTYLKEGHLLASTVNEDPNFLSWSTQKITFTETELSTVIATLNKTYQSNVVIATEIPPSCLVTVSFDHQTLEAVLHVLETTLNLTFKKTGDRIEIIRAGC